MKTGKTLYRNTDNKRIAGVCSGLADYFGADAETSVKTFPDTCPDVMFRPTALVQAISKKPAW